MRVTVTILAGALTVGAVLSACGGGKDKPPAGGAATPAPVTVAETLVAARDLPANCTLQNEGSIYEGYFARSFECGDVRLTNSVGFLKSADEARVWLSNNWGTMDGARDVIKVSLNARPTNEASLTIEDVTRTLPKLGAEEEKVYCVSFTGFDSSERVTEYWGALRYKSAVVQYTASALTSGACDNASRVPEMARALATAQLNKLRVALR